MVGFKSFSDKGDIVIGEAGVTAIVGPNGCGKSNVSDAIAWVLGEQSAKSLRGEKMEDVIFNGTRHRKPMGMAEVTLTLMETEPVAARESANGHNGAGGTNGHGNGNGNGHFNGHGHPGPHQIVVQRRLYRDGESAYLMNGRPCRLRDIQDVFLGTGLGASSYAIIEQGRVGQLLSAKPMDRRGLIEEAAGITKFKAKRKLAESRLEASRQNLSRVNDILAEVDRQRSTLKRQAGKARRFIEVRDRMRSILGVVFSSRAEMAIERQEAVELALGGIDGEGKRLESEIEALSAQVRAQREEAGRQEELLETSRARHAETELEHEKAAQRIERFQDQIRSLEERKQGLALARQRAEEELGQKATVESAENARLGELDQARTESRLSLEQANAAVADLNARSMAEERAIEELRKRQFDAVGAEARINNEIAGREEMTRRLDAESARLEREAGEARRAALQTEELLAQLGAERASHETAMNALKSRLAETERNLEVLKDEHAGAVRAAAAAKSREEALRNRLNTMGELAVRRAYSTEAAQRFFEHVRKLDWSGIGILADFVDVEPEYEAIVEDFLRFELQYVVVEDLRQARESLSVVREVTKGRLECFVLDGNGSEPEPPATIDGAVPLISVLRLNDRVRRFAGAIRDAYLVDSLEEAWDLSRRHPKLRFVARTGEVACGPVIGWGEHEAHGPLALRREIRELDRSIDRAVRETASREADAARLGDLASEAAALSIQLRRDLQEMEKGLLTYSHRTQSLDMDLARARQRAAVADAENVRYAEERGELEYALVQARAQLEMIAASKVSIEEEIVSRRGAAEQLRGQADAERRELGRMQSELAVLEERRAATARSIAALGHEIAALSNRRDEASRQILLADGQQDQARATIQGLEESRAGLAAERERLSLALEEINVALDTLREALGNAETRWDEARAMLDGWKDRHNALEIERTQIESDLRHLAAACASELNDTIESVCLRYFETLPTAELDERERECRELRDRMDGFGAVNMMAVEEHQEAEDRFHFLSTQRQDLLDSIRDTALAIDEIDAVCRKQFRDAYEAINAGFKESFVTLFGGGHGELRLIEDSTEIAGGVEIVAQPPGKKLQNVLLLSGGEKALTALALLIALFRFKPSPFCVLDEVDAPLDDANVDRFANMVREMSKQTQFIVITHSKRTMETASTLYGVTMEEPGISKIVSVRLN
jgi:chromosome segregation protein